MELREMEKPSPGFLANKYWFYIFSAGFAIFVGLPFLAPVLMAWNFPKGAELIYGGYKYLCHQLPERSFFLFGSKAMYSLQEIQNAYQVTTNPFLLRKFIGNTQMGWKVAWSDRMVAMYASVLIAAWIWYPLRKKVKALPFWGLTLFLLPMALDGITHMISDFSGIGQGFRDSNLWLAELTNNQFVAGFYSGDALGSFNSWMRLSSGFLFGIGIVFFGFPYIEEIFEANLERITITQEQLKNLKEKSRQDIIDFKNRSLSNKHEAAKHQ